MEDLKAKAVSQRGALQRLMHMIPGFRGYMDREARRDVDKIQRDFCADRLMAQKRTIQRVLEEVVRGGDIDGVGPFDRLMNKLDAVAQKVKNADRGWTGMFATIKVDEATLDKLYEYDLGLAEAATEVAHKVAEMTADDRQALAAKVKETVELLERVEDFFRRREELLRKGS